MAAPRFQELEHALVGAARLAGEGERHEVLQVEIVDADRVGIAQRPKGHLCRGPDADSRDRLEDGGRGRANLEPIPREICEAFEPGRLPGRPSDDVGPALLNAERVECVVGECSQRLGWRLEPEPMGRGDRSRCRFAVTGDEATKRRDRLAARDLLFEDGREQRFEDRAGPTNAQVRMATGLRGNHVVERRIEARRVVVEAEERGKRFECVVGTGTPRFCFQASSAQLREERRWTVGRPRRTDERARRDAAGWIAATAEVQPGHGHEVQGSGEVDRTAGHAVILGVIAPSRASTMLAPMLLVLVFAFIAGVLTILAPCALPVIPLALGAGSTGGRRRVTGLVLGFGVTFVGVTVLLAAALAALGLTTVGLRVVSVIVLVGAGLSLAVPQVEAFLERRLGPLAGVGVRVAGDQRESGFGGGIVLGAAIGLLWAPCVGPIMAGVIAAAAVHGPSIETVAIAIAYVAGAAVPIAAIAGWGRRASEAMRTLSARVRLRRGFGVAMLVTALLVGTGLDRGLQTAVADVLPAGWAGALIAIEQEPAIQEELDMMRTDSSAAPIGEGPMVGGTDTGPGAPNLPAPIAASLPSSVALENLGTAPEFTGITAWINSEPLKLAELRGKVVLVEFWTFGCINCIHVAPYVKAWEARYADAGLVVVGVHTPELPFEREIDNVRDAVMKAEIRYPVAFDPTFDTWHAFRNRYWPAFFFIDKSGQIRHVHYGEGDYDGSEQVIRQLLAATG